VIISGTPDLAQKLAFYGVIICWWLFALTFWLKKHPAKVQEAKRDWSSLLGLLVQSIAYFLLWLDPMRRKALAPARVEPPVLAWGIGVVALAIAIGSVCLVNAAARQLGKQWALAARLVEGHDLVQDGPYRFVRNPIYTGMFGMLLATGLAVSQWKQLAIAIAVFLAGTHIRIQSEERLLRQAFGGEFDAYKKRVPALIPGVY
jgi:protein-S-isoprenylcysteine O-methyltransferase Ste14